MLKKLFLFCLLLPFVINVNNQQLINANKFKSSLTSTVLIDNLTIEEQYYQLTINNQVDKTYHFFNQVLDNEIKKVVHNDQLLKKYQQLKNNWDHQHDFAINNKHGIKYLLLNVFFWILLVGIIVSVIWYFQNFNFKVQPYINRKILQKIFQKFYVPPYDDLKLKVSTIINQITNNETSLSNFNNVIELLDDKKKLFNDFCEDITRINKKELKFHSKNFTEIFTINNNANEEIENLNKKYFKFELNENKFINESKEIFIIFEDILTKLLIKNPDDFEDSDYFEDFFNNIKELDKFETNESKKICLEIKKYCNAIETLIVVLHTEIVKNIKTIKEEYFNKKKQLFIANTEEKIKNFFLNALKVKINSCENIFAKKITNILEIENIELSEIINGLFFEKKNSDKFDDFNNIELLIKVFTKFILRCQKELINTIVIIQKQKEFLKKCRRVDRIDSLEFFSYIIDRKNKRIFFKKLLPKPKIRQDDNKKDDKNDNVIDTKDIKIDVNVQKSFFLLEESFLQSPFLNFFYDINNNVYNNNYNEQLINFLFIFKNHSFEKNCQCDFCRENKFDKVSNVYRLVKILECFNFNIFLKEIVNHLEVFCWLKFEEKVEFKNSFTTFNNDFYKKFFNCFSKLIKKDVIELPNKIVKFLEEILENFLVKSDHKQKIITNLKEELEVKKTKNFLYYFIVNFIKSFVSKPKIYHKKKYCMFINDLEKINKLMKRINFIRQNNFAYFNFNKKNRDDFYNKNFFLMSKCFYNQNHNIIINSAIKKWFNWINSKDVYDSELLVDEKNQSMYQTLLAAFINQVYCYDFWSFFQEIDNQEKFSGYHDLIFFDGNKYFQKIILFKDDDNFDTEKIAVKIAEGILNHELPFKTLFSNFVELTGEKNKKKIHEVLLKLLSSICHFIVITAKAIQQDDEKEDFSLPFSAYKKLFFYDELKKSFEKKHNNYIKIVNDYFKSKIDSSFFAQQLLLAYINDKNNFNCELLNLLKNNQKLNLNYFLLLIKFKKQYFRYETIKNSLKALSSFEKTIFATINRPINYNNYVFSFLEKNYHNYWKYYDINGEKKLISNYNYACFLVNFLVDYILKKTNNFIFFDNFIDHLIIFYQLQQIDNTDLIEKITNLNFSLEMKKKFFVFVKENKKSNNRNVIFNNFFKEFLLDVTSENKENKEVCKIINAIVESLSKKEIYWYDFFTSFIKKHTCQEDDPDVFFYALNKFSHFIQKPFSFVRDINENKEIFNIISQEKNCRLFYSYKFFYYKHSSVFNRKIVQKWININKKKILDMTPKDHQQIQEVALANFLYKIYHYDFWSMFSSRKQITIKDNKITYFINSNFFNHILKMSFVKIDDFKKLKVVNNIVNHFQFDFNNSNKYITDIIDIIDNKNVKIVKNLLQELYLDFSYLIFYFIKKTAIINNHFCLSIDFSDILGNFNLPKVYFNEAFSKNDLISFINRDLFLINDCGNNFDYQLFNLDSGFQNFNQEKQKYLKQFEDNKETLKNINAEINELQKKQFLTINEEQLKKELILKKIIKDSMRKFILKKTFSVQNFKTQIIYSIDDLNLNNYNYQMATFLNKKHDHLFSKNCRCQFCYMDINSAQYVDWLSNILGSFNSQFFYNYLQNGLRNFYLISYNDKDVKEFNNKLINYFEEQPQSVFNNFFYQIEIAKKTKNKNEFIKILKNFLSPILKGSFSNIINVLSTYLFEDDYYTCFYLDNDVNANVFCLHQMNTIIKKQIAFYAHCFKYKQKLFNDFVLKQEEYYFFYISKYIYCLIHDKLIDCVLKDWVWYIKRLVKKIIAKKENEPKVLSLLTILFNKITNYDFWFHFQRTISKCFKSDDGEKKIFFFIGNKKINGILSFKNSFNKKFFNLEKFSKKICKNFFKSTMFKQTFQNIINKIIFFIEPCEKEIVKKQILKIFNEINLRIISLIKNINIDTENNVVFLLIKRYDDEFNLSNEFFYCNSKLYDEDKRFIFDSSKKNLDVKFTENIKKLNEEILPSFICEQFLLASYSENKENLNYQIGKASALKAFMKVEKSIKEKNSNEIVVNDIFLIELINEAKNKTINEINEYHFQNQFKDLKEECQNKIIKEHEKYFSAVKTINEIFNFKNENDFENNFKLQIDTLKKKIVNDKKEFVIEANAKKDEIVTEEFKKELNETIAIYEINYANLTKKVLDTLKIFSKNIIKLIKNISDAEISKILNNFIKDEEIELKLREEKKLLLSFNEKIGNYACVFFSLVLMNFLIASYLFNGWQRFINVIKIFVKKSSTITINNFTYVKQINDFKIDNGFIIKNHQNFYGRLPTLILLKDYDQLIQILLDILIFIFYVILFSNIKFFPAKVFKSYLITAIIMIVLRVFTIVNYWYLIV